MKHEITRDELSKIATRAGLNIEEFRVDYNGRNMLDKTCLGLVTCQGIGVVTAVAFAFAKVTGLTETDVIELFDSTRQDSTGLDAIYYWPHITVTD